jgi:GH15 family glucan-1,4-alpha-glucosidase
MRSTYERIDKELGYDGLLLRYARHTDDGLPPGEGAFGICSFWAVEYLARIGRVEEAERRLGELCACANDVGLFAEEIDPRGRRALGNFPQAFSHVGLVSAALAIDEARGMRPKAGLDSEGVVSPRGRQGPRRQPDDLGLGERR